MAHQRQFDRLAALAGRKNRLIKKVVILDGEDFTFWHKPMVISEYTEAKSKCKNPEDALENAVRLFVNKALDENGQHQYQSDAIPLLMKVVPFDLASELIGSLTSGEDEEEEVELDMKSAEEAAQTGKGSSRSTRGR